MAKPQITKEALRAMANLSGLEISDQQLEYLTEVHRFASRSDMKVVGESRDAELMLWPTGDVGAGGDEEGTKRLHGTITRVLRNAINADRSASAAFA